jgi:Protein of unknown function (DUF3485)
MSARPRTWRILAPIFSASIMLIIIVTQGEGASSIEKTKAYHERVREAIERIPYSLSDPVGGTTWSGTNVPVTPSAEKLLRPNKIIQRQYRDLSTGRSFSLLLVHCKDVRDMVGHYPPNCYPANGWLLENVEPRAVGLGDQQLPALDYTFTRVEDGAIERTLLVRNFFLLPNAGRARVVSDYDALIKASRGRSSTTLGAAQIQILGGNDLDEKERQRITELFIRMIEPVIDVVGQGDDE